MTYNATNRQDVKRQSGRRHGVRVHNFYTPPRTKRYIPEYNGPFALVGDGPGEVKVTNGLINIASESTIHEFTEADSQGFPITGSGDRYVYFRLRVVEDSGEAAPSVYDINNSASLPTNDGFTFNVLIGRAFFTDNLVDYFEQHQYGNIYCPVSIFEEDSFFGTERLFFAGHLAGGSRGIPYAKAVTIEGSTTKAYGDAT